MPQAHVPCSNSERRESEVSINWILRLPYLQGVSADQSPKLLTHHCRVVNTPRCGIRGRVHNVLIPESSVQYVKHEPVVLFGQVRSLEFQAMGCQDPQAEKLVIQNQADGEGQRIFASTHKQSTFCDLKMVNKIC